MVYEDQSIKMLLNQEEEEFGDAGADLPIGDDLEEVPAVEEESEGGDEEVAADDDLGEEGF